MKPSKAVIPSEAEGSVLQKYPIPLEETMLSTDSAFNTAIFKALCACLEIQPSSADASALIRPFPNDPESPPPPSRSTNVIYYDIRPEEAPDAGYQTFTSSDPTASSVKPSVSSFLPYKLILICYGPDCEQYAHRIRSFLFLDGSGYPRGILRQAGIYPVPRPQMPVLLDEYEGNLLRRRADLTIELRVADTLVRNGRRYGIAEVPAVVLNHS